MGSLGHPSEDETGLTYMRARYYDPQVGRFVSEDASKDGANWLAYCSNNPVNFLDSTGKDLVTWLIWLMQLAFAASPESQAKMIIALYAAAMALDALASSNMEKAGNKLAAAAALETQALADSGFDMFGSQFLRQGANKLFEAALKDEANSILQRVVAAQLREVVWLILTSSDVVYN